MYFIVHCRNRKLQLVSKRINMNCFPSCNERYIRIGFRFLNVTPNWFVFHVNTRSSSGFEVRHFVTNRRIFWFMERNVEERVDETTAYHFLIQVLCHQPSEWPKSKPKRKKMGNNWILIFDHRNQFGCSHK